MSKDNFKEVPHKKSLIFLGLSALLFLSIGLPIFLRTNSNTFDKLTIPKIVQLKSDAKEGEYYQISNYPPKNHSAVYKFHTTAAFGYKEAVSADFTELSEIQSNPPAFTNDYVTIKGFKDSSGYDSRFIVLVADRKTPILPAGAKPVTATAKKVIYYLLINSAGKQKKYQEFKLFRDKSNVIPKNNAKINLSNVKEVFSVTPYLLELSGTGRASALSAPTPEHLSPVAPGPAWSTLINLNCRSSAGTLLTTACPFLKEENPYKIEESVVEETIANKKVKSLKVKITSTNNQFWNALNLYKDLNYVEFLFGSAPTKAVPAVFTYKYKLGRALKVVTPNTLPTAVATVVPTKLPTRVPPGGGGGNGCGYVMKRDLYTGQEELVWECSEPPVVDPTPDSDPDPTPLPTLTVSPLPEDPGSEDPTDPCAVFKSAYENTQLECLALSSYFDALLEKKRHLNSEKWSLEDLIRDEPVAEMKVSYMTRLIEILEEIKKLDKSIDNAQEDYKVCLSLKSSLYLEYFKCDLNH